MVIKSFFKQELGMKYILNKALNSFSNTSQNLFC